METHRTLFDCSLEDDIAGDQGRNTGLSQGNFLDKEMGSIEVGKLADLIVIDRHLFDIPTSEISEARVMLALFERESVWGRGDDVESED